MLRKRVLIVGATGMLGHTLLRILDKRKDIELFASARNIEQLSHLYAPKVIKKIFNNVDANNFDSFTHKILEVNPEVIVNCIGVIKQSPLADDSIASISINSLFPHKLASICQSIGTRLIHISSDCVFKGDKGNYTEADPSDAVDLYGRTKFLGEVIDQNCITLRTSIIGHELNSSYGLVDWFLSQEGHVQGFTNAIFTGFPAIEIARIVAEYVIPNKKLNGLYHLSSNQISKHDLLRLVAKYYNKNIIIEPYSDFHCDRSLDSSRFRAETGYSPPPWEKLVESMHNDFIKTVRR